MEEPVTSEVPSSRRLRAIASARLAIADLRSSGVEMKLVGSLARGTFHEGSDVDFLVVSCPAHLKYAIEGSIEDHLLGIPFDVIYLDEIPADRLDRLDRFTRDAVDVDTLS